jgi:hypothetical protein
MSDDSHFVEGLKRTGGKKFTSLFGFLFLTTIGNDMKPAFVLFMMSSMFIGCIADYNTNEDYSIVNRSNQKITLVPAMPMTGAGYKFDSVSLSPYEIFEMHLSEPGGSPFPLHNTKKIALYFDDTIRVDIYRDSVSKIPSGNILMQAHW